MIFAIAAFVFLTIAGLAFTRSIAIAALLGIGELTIVMLLMSMLGIRWNVFGIGVAMIVVSGTAVILSRRSAVKDLKIRGFQPKPRNLRSFVVLRRFHRCAAPRLRRLRMTA